VRYELGVARADPPLRGHLPLGDDHVAVTSRWIEVDGRPTLPVSSEVHFSRVPRAVWPALLAGVRDGGASHVATYLFWNHHEATEGDVRFDGDLDVHAFAREVRRLGLGLVLRIGPYAHGEARHGGLPDWLLGGDVQARTDDPAYLCHVRRWYRAIAQQLRGIPLFAIQVENELYDNPRHLLTLKRMAREAGLSAPLWIGTAWGGANLPADELLPLYAGYSEAFWIGADAGFDAASASNFYFSDERDEVEVGADTRDTALTPSNLDLDRYPYATCELGGGMVSAYHRRPYAAPRDLAALALAKLGSGSVWQGYYMYADGRNPARRLQESHASGGRNDFPELAYDFGAPLAIDAHRRESWYQLRLQHHLLAAWGSDLATMPATLPAASPAAPDVTHLRWAVRSDGERGFLFVVNHQPGVELPQHAGVEFVVDLSGSRVELPAVDVAAGSCFVWPLRLAVGRAQLEWATAQPVTLVAWRGSPLLVLTATAGIPAELHWASGAAAPLHEAGPGEWYEVRDAGGVLARALVLDEADGLRLAVRAGRLVLERDACLELLDDGWVALSAGPVRPLATVEVSPVRRASRAPAPATGGPLRRASIPEDWSGAAVFELAWVEEPGASLVVDWDGDVARLWDGDRLVSDALFTGREWRISAAELARSAKLRLEVLPRHPEAHIHIALDRPGAPGVRSARLEFPEGAPCLTHAN